MKESSYNSRNIIHRRQIQYAKKTARENMVANGILSMDSTEIVPSSFGSSGGGHKSYRRAMMDRQRAMDQVRYFKVL